MKYDFLLVWGIFRKFPVQAKCSFSPCACCVHARGGRVFPFFLRLAVLYMVLLRQFKILLGRWIGGEKNFKTLISKWARFLAATRNWRLTTTSLSTAAAARWPFSARSARRVSGGKPRTSAGTSSLPTRPTSKATSTITSSRPWSRTSRRYGHYQVLKWVANFWRITWIKSLSVFLLMTSSTAPANEGLFKLI